MKWIDPYEHALCQMPPASLCRGNGLGGHWFLIYHLTHSPQVNYILFVELSGRSGERTRASRTGKSVEQCMDQAVTIVTYRCVVLTQAPDCNERPHFAAACSLFLPMGAI